MRVQCYYHVQTWKLTINLGRSNINDAFAEFATGKRENIQKQRQRTFHWSWGG